MLIIPDMPVAVSNYVTQLAKAQDARDNGNEELAEIHEQTAEKIAKELETQGIRVNPRDDKQSTDC